MGLPVNWLVITSLLATQVALADLDRYPAELESGYDGDTITVWALVQYDLKRLYKLRIVGVDTPEIKGAKCVSERDKAYAARDFTINTLIARDFEIELTGKMTFDRHLARVYVDGQDVATIIIAEGLGRPNHGEQRQGWC